MRTDAEVPVRAIGLAAVNLQGFVDAVERGVVYGWAWDPQRPAENVRVEILHGGRRLAVVAADRFRDDLVELEIGDGRHAFEYALPDHLAGRADASEIEVRFAGSPVPLPRMKVRPQRRPLPDAAPRPAEEMIAALQERIVLQEQVINDMGNLLRVLADRLKPGAAADGGREARVLNGLESTLAEQGRTLNSIEAMVASFGRNLRDVVEGERSPAVAGAQPAGRFRAMDLAFLLLLAGSVISLFFLFGGTAGK